MIKKLTILLLFLVQVNIYTQDFKFGKVTKEELKERFYPLDSTADASYLYKYRRSYFEWNASIGWFKLVTEVHHRIKIYTKDGFDYATKSIVYYKPDSGEPETVSSIKGYTYILEDGKVKKEKLSKKNIFKEKINSSLSEVKITMPNIKEGSVIEFKYKVFSPYPTFIDDVELQKGIPIKNLKSQVEFPEFYTFNKRNKGFLNIPEKASTKNGNVGATDFNIKVFSYEGKDIQALKDDEPFVSNANNFRGGIEYELAQTNFRDIGGTVKNFSTSWNAISKQISKSSSFGGELNKSSYYKNDLDQILSKNTNDNAKIGAIFQFVKSKIKWNGEYGKYPQKGVKKAYKENVGNVADINLVLTSMLRSAGLNANPVLISSRRSSGIPLFPTLDGFDYVISMVQFPDNTYYLLDASEFYSIPNILPIRALNWRGRVISQGGLSSWVNLPSSKHATEENMLMVKITDDFLVNGFVRSKFENLSALSFRNLYNHIKDEELISKYEDDHNIEVEDFKLTNQTDLIKPITRTVKFSSEDLIEEINGKLYIEPLLFLAQHKNPFKANERKFPVDFGTALKNVNKVTIQIPEGYSVEKLPETMAIALPEDIGVFKYQVTNAGNKIRVVSIVQLNKPKIAALNYPHLKDFYSKLVKKESEKVILTKI